MTLAFSGFLILGLPLLAFLLIVFVTRRNKSLSAAVGIVCIAVAALVSLLVVFPQVAAGATGSIQFNWLPLLPPGAAEASGTEPYLTLGIGVDPLAAIMLVVVT